MCGFRRDGRRADMYMSKTRCWDFGTVGHETTANQTPDFGNWNWNQQDGFGTC